MLIDTDVLKQAAEESVQEALVRFAKVPEPGRRILNPFRADSLWGSDGSSPMQDAIGRALVAATKEMVARQLNDDPEFTEKVRAVTKEATDRVFGENREKTVARVAEAISVSLTGSDCDDD